MSAPTALLVFAQSALADARSKRLAKQMLPNRSVLAQLTRRTRQLADATGLPVLHSIDLIPHTGRFGDQLTAALSAAFARGYERVLVVGNDCPALTTAHLTRAATELESAAVLLGPDQRGGLYLFGLSRAAFESLSLAKMPWQTNRLAWAVRQACSDWPTVVLPSLGDVNSRADLQRYRADTPTTAAFVRYLMAISMGSCHVYADAKQRWAVRFFARIQLVRGPPVLTDGAALAA